MSNNKATGAAPVILTALIFVALVFVAGWGTMLLVGALHAAVPVVPAISYVGALWVNVLGMWFRMLFGSAISK